MAELEAAYQRIDQDKVAFRKLRAELEIIASLGETEDSDVIVECINTIDDALSERVVA